MKCHLRFRIRSSIVALAIAASAAAQASDLTLRLTASSDTLGRSAGLGRDVEITITRWSTELEQLALAGVFVKQGPWGLVDTLRKASKVGRIKVSSVAAYDVRFAARYALPRQGQRLILITNRPMSPWVTWTQVPVSDYPFSLVEVHLDQNGTGSGKLSLATRIIYDEEHGIVALDRYSRTPLWIQNVRVEARY